MNTYDLVKLVICSTTCVLVTALLAFAVVGWQAYRHALGEPGASFGRILEKGDFLRICVAVMVIIAVIDLALLDKLGPGAISLLSGVAGYALGGLQRGNDQEKPGKGESGVGKTQPTVDSVQSTASGM